MRRLRAIPTLSKSDLRRFWSSVKKKSGQGPDGECWEWTGAKSSGGYGTIGLGKSCFLVHRVSYFLAHGSIHDRLFVCHTCDNRPCVRPEHLFHGTHQDNARDAAIKRHLASGKAGPYKEPEEIRRELRTGDLLRVEDVAKQLGISWNDVYQLYEDRKIGGLAIGLDTIRFEQKSVDAYLLRCP